MPAGEDPAAVAALPRFVAWRAAIAKDADLGRDARMMVPLFFDVERQKTKVVVFLGWDERPATISFATPPTVEVEGGSDTAVSFDDVGASLVYPVTEEVYVTRVLDRDEVRKICDEKKTRTEILKALVVPSVAAGAD
jgi:hypothetical protein